MLRSIIWYGSFIFSLIGTIPKMLKVNNMDKNIRCDEDKAKRDNFVFDFVKNWSKKRLDIAGANVNLHGVENIPKNEAVLFISNHQSNFDIALFLGCIDFKKGFVAKLELGKIPILNKWMEKIDCIFMDRSSVRKSAHAIATATKQLKEGRSMVIFPEGTRSKTGHLGEFKSGSFKLATKSKVKIIPVTISNSRTLMEKNNNIIKPGDVEIYIHPPVETINLTKEEEDALPDKVKSIIQSKLVI